MKTLELIVAVACFSASLFVGLRRRNEIVHPSAEQAVTPAQWCLLIVILVLAGAIQLALALFA
jgi:hypothetical protein